MMTNGSRIFLVFVLVAALAPIAPAQVPPDADVNVQMFLRSVYPDLFQRSVTFVWDTDGTKRRLSVVDGSVDPLNAKTAARLMEADIELDSAQTVRGFSARGAYLNDPDNRRLASAMKSAGGIDAAIVAIGRPAPFGPQRRPDLPANVALSTASKQQLRVIASGAATSVDQDHGFLWSVTAESARTGQTYVLTFEPFDGRLVSMVER